jgi:hypothetical protein
MVEDSQHSQNIFKNINPIQQNDPRLDFYGLIFWLSNR